MEVGKEKREAETGKGMTKVEKARGKVEEQVEEEETGRKRLLDQDGGGEVNEKRRKDSRDEEDQEAESANQPPEQIMIDGGQREECRNGAKRMKECDGGRHARDDGKEEREFVEELARKYFLLLLKKYPACFSQAREGARKDNRGKHMQLPENREKMNRVVRPVQECWKQASESLYEKFKPAGDSAVERALQKQLKTAKVCAKSKKLCILLSLQNSLLQHEILSGPGTTHEFQEILWDKSKSFFGWTGFTVANPDDFFFRFYSLHRLVMYLASRRNGSGDDAFAGDDMGVVMSKLKEDMYEDLEQSCDVVSGLLLELGFKSLSFKQALEGLEPFVYRCTTSTRKKAKM